MAFHGRSERRAGAEYGVDDLGVAAPHRREPRVDGGGSGAVAGERHAVLRQATLFEPVRGSRSRRWTGTAIIGRTGSRRPTGAADPTSGRAGPDPAQDAAIGTAHITTSNADGGGPGRWAETFVRAVAEILTGRRPVDQVANWVSPEAMTVLRQAASARVVNDCSVASVRVCARAPAGAGVEVVPTVEMLAVLRFARVDQVRAMAGRLEFAGGRWRCAELQFVGGLPGTRPGGRRATGSR